MWLSGIRIWHCRELWLGHKMWLRLCIAVIVAKARAAAPIPPIAQELPYAAPAALKKEEEKKKKPDKYITKTETLYFTHKHRCKNYK